MMLTFALPRRYHGEGVRPGPQLLLRCWMCAERLHLGRWHCCSRRLLVQLRRRILRTGADTDRSAAAAAAAAPPPPLQHERGGCKLEGWLQQNRRRQHPPGRRHKQHCKGSDSAMRLVLAPTTPWPQPDWVVSFSVSSGGRLQRTQTIRPQGYPL
mmetsp:Transcript_19846/g.52213  ORF Transcript_19846/g.52213 Transcript_19846/m.52213 type:complete len:155 (+) Transcript_19846:250-714(+)